MTELAVPVDPGDFSRRILVGVTGLTPQVITETLYALAVEQKTFVPTEIHVMTTSEGAARVEMLLLDQGRGRFHQLCRDYGLPEIAFDESRIHVIRDTKGVAYSDIQTPEQQNLAADAITQLLRELTKDENAALHVSLAGGRKSMGFFLGYALSLFGRRQDRLSHVLVSEPFESHPDFFYPPPEPAVLRTREQKPIRTSDARIMLADIPFVRLRNGLPNSLLEGEASFSEVVAAARVISAEPHLVIDLCARIVMCGGLQVTMKPADFAFYTWLARRSKKGLKPENAVNWRSTTVDVYLKEYHALVGYSGDYERAEESLKNGFSDVYIRERVSRIKTSLDRALGLELAEPYRLAYAGKKGRGGYILSLNPQQIEIIEQGIEK